MIHISRGATRLGAFSEEDVREVGKEHARGPPGLATVDRHEVHDAGARRDGVRAPPRDAKGLMTNRRLPNAVARDEWAVVERCRDRATRGVSG